MAGDSEQGGVNCVGYLAAKGVVVTYSRIPYSEFVATSVELDREEDLEGVRDPTRLVI
jgi:hypothetical protein